MISCRHCQREKPKIAISLSYCPDCIREDNEAVMHSLKQDHSKVRRENRLPSETTAKEDEPACVICARNCRPAPGEKSFCGLKEKNSKIMHHGSLSDRG
ncbi:MAG: hypothetical protein R6U91_04855, partial [Bacillota bacterium]